MTGGGPSASRPQLAVLGSPIAHSQSPALHSAAYRALGFDADYGSIEVTSGGLRAFIDGLSGDWRGLSLTMPLKEEVLPLLATADRMATLTGAANTVLFESRAGDRRLQGFNTDVAGIVGALAGAGVSRAREVLVLGAGATARSAIVAAAQLGAAHVTIAARNPERASSAVAVGRSAGLAVTVIRMPEALGRVDADVTISTLPGGAFTADEVARVSPAPGSVLLDVAYAPWPSLLGTAWTAGADGRTGADSRTAVGGGGVVSGLLMLVHQALLQVRVFVNHDPEVELPGEPAVLAAMLDAVGLEP